MATGGLPFDDDNFSRLVSKVQNGVFFVPDEVDPRIATIIRGLLRVNADDRMTLDEVLATDWFSSRPLPEHMSALHHAVADACDGENVKQKKVAKDDGDWRARPDIDYAAVPEPVMTVVVHLSELGLGEIPTILRRLRSDRQCIEKDYYSVIVAFVTAPTLPRAVTGEPPISPSGRNSPGRDDGVRGVMMSEAMRPFAANPDMLPMSIANERVAVGGITAGLQTASLQG
eukprot:Plantae.Rhodophyta-Palmaria_palmata.ctg19579.p1 GENE.Plantae.Rhodophyta-Palmaria_palmata.ctg19579~~Plantae.Rhodophyta-Palmaria_palmata.ctg19579.p1  ORF type:complete len:229 (+),score=28.48 Plantae.Rhodophyta-Palmaria_palmata.ctg19579:360-1046(+)